MTQDEILRALEPAQRSAQKYKPYPRRKLGWRVQALLWLLRAYVLVAVPLVVYAFVKALLAGA
ncbi:hypothetical protein [Acidocella sp. KAb 2-4]|uniref:hypothetical protein n=1 Tax=Acidocella sp. KAb 2-4 TaxID=2885158 RepID=UPI001D08D173|nr:hypothetical protein [Acidocella sp. KAb 2-4]MCB5944818.1 hypothetical protein [Acidocella sp. KAb 2-4]